MKHFIITSLLLTALTSVHAQLTNTRWKAKVNIEQPVNVILDFKKDTCSLYTVFDSSIIEVMTYNIQDTVLTLTKVEGQSDCDNSTPGKYRFAVTNNIFSLKMLADDCSDRSTVIDDTKWTPWVVPPEIALDAVTLQQFVGTYQLDAGHPINITLENGKLYAEGQNNGLPKSALYAESQTRFFLKVAGVSFDFKKDAGGKVVSFISHEDKDYELKKVQ